MSAPRRLLADGRGIFTDDANPGNLFRSRKRSHEQNSLDRRDPGGNGKQNHDASENLADLFQRSHAIVGALLPACAFGVALLNPAGAHLEFAYYHDESTPSHASSMLLLCEQAVQRAAPMLLCPETAAGLPGHLQAAVNSMAGGVLAVPLTTADGILGVVVLRTAMKGSAYTAAERDLLMFVADQLAAAIERKRLHEQMHFLAMHDELTRLPNRRLFHDRLDTALAHAHRHQTGLSLLFIDLNRFKQVNDRYGHACGDLLLRQVGQRIASCLRASDTLARVGGDEFVVLLANIAMPSDAKLCIEKIHLALAAPFDLGEASPLQVSVSIGIAQYPEHGDDRPKLLAQADKSMYAAKAAAAVACPQN